MRIAGGTGAIIAALADNIPSNYILLNTKVTHITLGGTGVELSLRTRDCNLTALRAEYVVAALPQRLGS